MKGLFVFGTGLALGVFGYRYVQANGWRLPQQFGGLSEHTDAATLEAQQRAGQTTERAMRAAQRTNDDGTINVPRPGITTIPHQGAVMGAD
ncbi:MAG: hypothetical protein JO247_08135 [Chloroflexi bacterium]|nr:hypothetical protein [Chloroflexota bacterium]